MRPGSRLPRDAALAVAALVEAGVLPPGEYRAARKPTPFWKQPREGQEVQATAPAASRIKIPCIHLGDPVGDRACSGRQPRRCKVHGRCTILPCANASHSCEGGRGRAPCPDYVAGDGEPSLASAARTSASE